MNAHRIARTAHALPLGSRSRSLCTRTLSSCRRRVPITPVVNSGRVSVDILRRYNSTSNGPAKLEKEGAKEQQGASSEPLTQQSPRGARDRATVGVFTPTAAVVFILTGVGLYFYFNHEKQKLQEQKKKDLETRKWGKAAVGGPFSLATHDGRTFTDKDLLGKWSLVYFGFTNCPDICPEELDKMTTVVEELDKEFGPIAQPVFISVDPARDSPSAIKAYLADFHPRLVGLTGSYDQVKATCKTYRVYFSTPKDAKADGDYLVDHSIYFYLMDPSGEFVDAFGKSSEVKDVVGRVSDEVARWEKEYGRKA